MHWIVVGAGSAGCVVTRRLVDAGHHVTLVECGPPLRPGQVPPEVDGDDAFAAQLPERVHTGLLARRHPDGVAAPYVRGRGVGGSSAVNAMAALDADPRLYAAWGWDDVGPAEAAILIPRRVCGPGELGAVDRALLAADPAAAPVPLTRREGRRVTSAEAYLWPVLDSSRLDVLTNSLVDRVETSTNGVANGAVLADGTTVGGDRVVLCAGAIHSPAILQRSGLGGPAVGTHLQDHPAVAFLLGLRAGHRAQDPLGLAATTIVDDDPVQILALNHLGVPDGPGMLMVANMRPRSHTGTVRIRSADPLEHPSVDFDFFREPHDVAVLRRGVRRVLGLLGHPALREIVETAYVDDRGTDLSALGSDDDIDAWIRRRSADYVHATGTCGMGRVVDADGAVSATTGLHVCDASVFPEIPDVNTHLPTTVLAERLVTRWVRASTTGTATGGGRTHG